MQRLNDFDNDKSNLLINDIDAVKRRFINPEVREDGENEALADMLADKLHSSNRLPFLAVGYSSIPRVVIERHLATALEKSATPVRLFMHLIGREPLWQNYQSKKAKRRSSERPIT